MLEAAYYNEIDPYAAQWLRHLIAAGLIADGDVDERSIKDVHPADLTGYTQCHFFAGIGGWSRSLRLAGWPDDRPVWTGSCPCQPFSVAGKQKAQADDRHLWPAWYLLIRECRPATVFGEQVSGAITHGWLDHVYQGLESQGYAVAAAVLPACSVGAPHKRDRLWFVAHADQPGSQGRDSAILQECTGERIARSSNPSLADAEHWGIPVGRGNENVGEELYGSRGISGNESQSLPEQAKKTLDEGTSPNREPVGRPAISRQECDFWLVEPAVGRVAHGVSARVGKLRAFGNAIVPQVAAEFIGAFMETQNSPISGLQE